MALYNHIHGYYDSSYIQKIVNSYPIWSRARLLRESIAQRLVGAFGMYIEDTARSMRAAHANKFIATCDAASGGVYTYADIPRNFLFEYKSYSNDIVYIAPVVTVNTGTATLTPTIVVDLEDLDKALPSRMTISSANYAVTNVIDPVTVSNLSTATINDIDYANRLYITITGGTDFGTSDDKRFFYPAVVTLEGLLSKDIDRVEGKVFYSDDIARTWNKFADLEELTVSNMETVATITIDSWGFNQTFLLERAVTYSNVLGTHNLYYSIGLDATGNVNRTLLNYLTRETGDIQLQRQGYSNMVTTESLYLMSNTNHLIINDIAQMDMSDLIFACSDTNLYVYDTYIAAIQGINILKELKNRTVDAHIGLEIAADRRRFEIDEVITVTTRNKSPLARFSKPVRVRLYYTTDSGTQVYLDKTGSMVAATDAWRYNNLYDRGTTVWREKRWKISFNTVGERALTLETQFLRAESNPIDGYLANKVEYDVVPIAIGAKEALASFEFPTAVQPVKGISFDFDNNLWIRSEYNGLNTAYKVQLHYDYCLIDYDNYKMYFREPYTNIESIVSNGNSNWDPPVA